MARRASRVQVTTQAQCKCRVEVVGEMGLQHNPTGGIWNIQNTQTGKGRISTASSVPTRIYSEQHCVTVSKQIVHK